MNMQRAEENIENLHRNWAIKSEQIERAIEMIRRRVG
jgi:hypothetical protein